MSSLTDSQESGYWWSWRKSGTHCVVLELSKNSPVRILLGNSWTSILGDSQVGDNVMLVILWWWPIWDVGDTIIMLAIFSLYWCFQRIKLVTNILNGSSTSQTCKQHILSPTSVTSIDVTSILDYFPSKFSLIYLQYLLSLYSIHWRQVNKMRFFSLYRIKN